MILITLFYQITLHKGDLAGLAGMIPACLD